VLEPSAPRRGPWLLPAFVLLVIAARQSVRVLSAIGLAAAVAACASNGSGPEGGDGERCKCDDCTILSGYLYCDPGLVCNMDGCEPPQSVQEGGECPAFSSGFCAADLVCTFSANASAASMTWTCEPLVPCPAGQAYQISHSDPLGGRGACMPCLTVQTVCNGACVNKQTDPANCGACVNVCGGATPYCSAGVCSRMRN
jgi:hypothetical protein